MENIFNAYLELKLKCLGVRAFMNTEVAHFWAKNGKESGRCPSRRRPVQILGDARAGKTSLRKTLMGEEFNPEEYTTEGIETKMCHISTVDSKWHGKDIDGSVEYEEALSWYIVRQTIADYMSRNVKYSLKDILSFFLVAFCLILLLCYTSYLYSDGVCLLRRLPNWSEIWQSHVIRTIIVVVLSFIFGSDVAFILTGYAFNLSWSLLQVLHKQTALGLSVDTIIWLLAVIYISAFVSGMGLYGIILSIMVIQTLQAEDDLLCWHVSSPEIEKDLLMALTFGITFGLAVRALVTIILNIKHVSVLELPLIIMASFVSNFEKSYTYLFISGCLLGWLAFLSFFQGHSVQARIPVRYNGVITLTLPHTIMVIGYIITCLEKGEVSHMSYFAFMFFLSIGIILIDNKGIPDCLKIDSIFGGVILDDLRDKLALIVDGGSYLSRLPIWLRISDYAGQDIYYNTHHTFMTPDATYIVVFDLTDFVMKGLRDKAYKRILFWLRSIRTHSNSPILLVGTHADQFDPSLISDIQNYFKTKLSKVNDSFLDRIAWNGDSPFFAIDNRRRTSLDIRKLKTVIWKTANQSFSVKETHLIRWLKFYTFMNAKREAAKKCLMKLLMTVDEVKNGFDQTADDFDETLEYFNKIGEIFYNTKDPFLRQYVLLDKNVIVQAAEAIHLIPEITKQGSLMSYWKLLSERGILHFKVAKNLFDKDGAANANERVLVVLAMLESYNLICKIPVSELNNDAEVNFKSRPNYFVPSKLPHGVPDVPSDDDICKYYFDFGDFMPNALFSRLLACCQATSSLQCETDQSRYLYREGGEFQIEFKNNLGRFYFWLQLNTDNPEQNLIMVSVKPHCGSNPFNLLRHLWQQVEDLRSELFRGIRYHCGAECQWSPPHQMAEEKALHILDEAHQNQQTFLRPSKTFMCRHRKIQLDEHRQFRVMNAEGSGVQGHTLSQSLTGAPNVKGNHNVMINNPAVVNISERCIPGVTEHPIQGPAFGDAGSNGAIFEIEAGESSSNLRRRLTFEQSSE
ncbi:uncharacterized protein [Amphiura filiformis]|uniref:uncharacterized protein n=1 Tax=Amphiura filiformis TaxID=82378 RepID=UPI003B22673E